MMYKPSQPTPPSAITLGGNDFQFVAALEPARDAAGAIIEVSPQDRYEKAETYPLNVHGQGKFCEFRIRVAKRLSGVYALLADETVSYIGICADLGARFNAGYGHISPRNCYKHGQQTNCKINRRVLDVSKAGGLVALYFFPTADRVAIEKHLLGLYSPPWNG